MANKFNKNKSVHLAFVATLFSAITGCSSTKTVVPNLNSEPNRIEKAQRVIAIDGKKLIGLETTTRPGAVQLTVVYGMPLHTTHFAL